LVAFGATLERESDAKDDDDDGLAFLTFGPSSRLFEHDEHRWESSPSIMDTHKQNPGAVLGAPWRAVFGRLVGSSSLVFVFVFSKGRKVSRNETNLFAFSREKCARVVEREFRDDATVFGE